MLVVLRRSLTLLGVLTLVCGVAYPAAVTAVAQLAFPESANGSLVRVDGRVVGSALLAQPFTDPGWLWPRPSAAGYDAAGSGGSNLGPTNPALTAAVRERLAALGLPAGEPVPVDLVTASGSGLDPHLSPAAARAQAPRIAAARGLDTATVLAAIAAETSPRTLGFLGEPRVDVLAVNLRLGPPPAR